MKIFLAAFAFASFPTGSFASYVQGSVDPCDHGDDLCLADWLANNGNRALSKQAITGVDTGPYVPAGRALSAITPPEPSSNLIFIGSGPGLDVYRCYSPGVIDNFVITLPPAGSLGSYNTATLMVPAYDIDLPYEIDKVYLNENFVGDLQGANGIWQLNTFVFNDMAFLNENTPNVIRIAITVSGWCAEIDWVAIQLGEDLCPNDPNKVHPGQCGCGVLDLDSDGDGIADCVEESPSGSPSLAPSAFPSSPPSSAPSSSPSSAPSSSPSSAPSSSPSCTPVSIEPLDGGVVFVDGASGMPANNGHFEVSILSGQDVTYDWTTTCPAATLTGADTNSAHMAIAAGTEPSICYIEVSVCDSCGGCLYSSGMVTIVDPSAGFVTGGGWIWSLEGAYVEDGTITGKASFGFVSKYKKGQSVPSGETQFVFHAAGLNFHSTSYEWLVVTGSGCAKYKGEGQVNGLTGYGFMLTACDANEPGVDDSFRVKIWAIVDDSTVYDNQMGVLDDSYDGTPIGGGNIQVHQAGGKRYIRA